MATNGTFTYIPARGHHGPDAFTYTLADPNTTKRPPSPSAVSGTPIAYTQRPSPAFLAARSPATSSATLADSDPESDLMTAAVASGPSHGSLTLHTDGSFSYTP